MSKNSPESQPQQDEPIHPSKFAQFDANYSTNPKPGIVLRYLIEGKPHTGYWIRLEDWDRMVAKVAQQRIEYAEPKQDGPIPEDLKKEYEECQAAIGDFYDSASCIRICELIERIGRAEAALMQVREALEWCEMFLKCGLHPGRIENEGCPTCIIIDKIRERRAALAATHPAPEKEG